MGMHNSQTHDSLPEAPRLSKKERRGVAAIDEKSVTRDACVNAMQSDRGLSHSPANAGHACYLRRLEFRRFWSAAVPCCFSRRLKPPSLALNLADKPFSLWYGQIHAADADADDKGTTF
jgi:hypothetical protein